MFSELSHWWLKHTRGLKGGLIIISLSLYCLQPAQLIPKEEVKESKTFFKKTFYSESTLLNYYNYLGEKDRQFPSGSYILVTTPVARTVWNILKLSKCFIFLLPQQKRHFVNLNWTVSQQTAHKVACKCRISSLILCSEHGWSNVRADFICGPKYCSFKSENNLPKSYKWSIRFPIIFLFSITFIHIKAWES